MTSDYGAVELGLSGTEKKSHYRPDIDGLRAVAVIAVILYHTNRNWLPGGFTGVDIFFVISGYVVTASVLRHPSTSILDSVCGFYARRAKRIGPAVIVMISLVALLMSLIVPPWTPKLREYYSVGMCGLVGVSNNFLATRETDYFDDPEDDQLNPFLHTWSLGVEEQFYFVFPLVMLAAYGNLSAWQDPHIDAVSASFGWRPNAIWIFGIVLSMVISALLTISRQQVAYYILPCRFWELALGGYAVHSQPVWSQWVQPPVVSMSIQSISALCIIVGFIITPSDSGFPFPWALLATFGTVLYIVAGVCPNSYLNRCLSSRPTIYIGKLSYSLYLWHWPVLAMMTWFVDSGTLLYAFISAVIFVFASVLSYHFVEQVILEWLPKQRWYIFALLVLTVGAAEVILGVLRISVNSDVFVDGSQVDMASLNSSKSQLSSSIDLGGNIRALQVGVSQQLQEGIGKDCKCRRQPQALHQPPGAMRKGQYPQCTPSIKPAAYHEGAHGSWHQKTCHAGWSGNVASWALARRCLVKRRTRRPVIYLIGDSHAAMLLTGLQEGAHARFDVFAYTGSAHRGSVSECCGRCKGLFMGPVRTILAQHLRKGDVLVIANFLSLGFRPCQSKHMKNLWMMRRITLRKQAQMLLVGEPQALPHVGYKCSPTWYNPNAHKKCEVPMDRKTAQYNNAMLSMARRTRDVFFLDSLGLMCTGYTCGAVIPGLKVLGMFDKHHLSLAGSRYLAPFFCTILSNMTR